MALIPLVLRSLAASAPIIVPLITLCTVLYIIRLSYARGEKIAKELLCGTCHLPNYAGRDQMPRLAGQHESYLLNTMRKFRNNQAVGRDTIMAASLYGVHEDDLRAMAHYFSQLDR